MVLKSFEIDYEKLYAIAKEKREECLLESDLYVLKKYFENNYDAKLFFEDLAVESAKRKEFLKEIFPATSKIFWELIGFILENDEAGFLPDISEGYSRFLAKKENIDFAELVLSQEAESKNLNEIREKFGKNISFKIMINPEILGGFVVKKLDGTVVDGSLKGRLEALRSKIKK